MLELTIFQKIILALLVIAVINMIATYFKESRAYVKNRNKQKNIFDFNDFLYMTQKENIVRSVSTAVDSGISGKRFDKKIEELTKVDYEQLKYEYGKRLISSFLLHVLYKDNHIHRIYTLTLFKYNPDDFLKRLQ